MRKHGWRALPVVLNPIVGLTCREPLDQLNMTREDKISDNLVYKSKASITTHVMIIGAKVIPKVIARVDTAIGPTILS